MLHFCLPSLNIAPVWFSATKCHIFNLSNKVRSRVRFLSRVRLLCYKADLLDIAHRRSVGALCFLHRIYVGFNNNPLQRFLSLPYVPSRCTGYASVAHIDQTISCCTDLSPEASCHYCCLWNSLPDIVFRGDLLKIVYNRCSLVFKVFKKCLLSHS